MLLENPHGGIGGRKRKDQGGHRSSVGGREKEVKGEQQAFIGMIKYDIVLLFCLVFRSIFLRLYKRSERDQKPTSRELWSLLVNECKQRWTIWQK